MVRDDFSKKKEWNYNQIMIQVDSNNVLCGFLIE